MTWNQRAPPMPTEQASSPDRPLKGLGIWDVWSLTSLLPLADAATLSHKGMTREILAPVQVMLGPHLSQTGRSKFSSIPPAPHTKHPAGMSKGLLLGAGTLPSRWDSGSECPRGQFRPAPTTCVLAKANPPAEVLALFKSLSQASFLWVSVHWGCLLCLTTAQFRVRVLGPVASGPADLH